MNRREISDSFPIDLIIEILLRLPAKSIARFHCVSKLWLSILRRPYIPKLFTTRSPTRPRLLFAIIEHTEDSGSNSWSFYSSPQHQNLKSSRAVSAHFHMKFRHDMRPEFCSLTSGLIYFHRILILKKDKDTVPVICNPSTGRFGILPNIKAYEKSTSLLGFDPIGKQYKVLLFMGYPLCNGKDNLRILTLGSGNMMWRKLQTSISHEPGGLESHICINGFLYYLAYKIDHARMIVCFDVRLEKFKFIHANSFSYGHPDKFINYKGKLGVFMKEYAPPGGSLAIKLSLWVLEDVEKQRWSKYVYTLPENKGLDPKNVNIAGVTSTGEIVLSDLRASKPFYVYYFNPERSTLHTVEIHGKHQVFDKPNGLYVFVDHVEDLQFNTGQTTYAITSISPPEQKRCKPTKTSKVGHHRKQDRRTFEISNKFGSLCLLDDVDG